MARRIISALLIILAVLLAPFAVGGLWAERTITDSRTFVETLSPLADDPAVQQAFATEVSGALVEAIDAQGRIEQVLSRINGPLAQLRPDNQVLAASIASGINGAIQSGVTSYTQSDRFGDVWLSMSSLLQQQFVALVERDTSNAAVTLQEGQVVLDTKAAAEKIQADLTARGVPFADQLDRVPGREVVLADTPNLQTAADALHVFLPVATWLWLVVLALLAAGVLLWRPRSRGLMWAGLGLALGGLVTYVALDLGQREIVDSAPPGYVGLMQALVSTLLRFLVNALAVMMAVGIALMLAGWLGGGTRSGSRFRRMIADWAHRWGAPLADSPIGRFTSEHPMFVPTLRALVIGLGVAYLVLADRRSPVEVLWTCLAIAAGLLLVEIVEGSGVAREQGNAGALVAEAPPGAAPAADGPPQG